MNKLLFAFVVLLASSSLYAQDGKVYFIRSEGFQAPMAAFNLFVDKKNVGTLNNKRFSVHDTKPGEHTFATQFVGKKYSDKSEKIKVQIEPGRTHYIQVRFKHGIFKNKLDLKELKEDEAKPMLVGLKQIKN